jgi:uncharacterized membrane protein
MKYILKKSNKMLPFLITLAFNLSVILAYGRAGGGGGGHSSGGSSSGGSHSYSGGSYSSGSGSSGGGTSDPTVAWVIFGIIGVVIIIAIIRKNIRKKT